MNRTASPQLALRLQAALDAGDLEADEPRLGARGALLRAVALARHGQLARARAAAEAALGDRPDDAAVALAAAAILRATHDYQRSLDALAAAARAAPAATRAAATRAVGYASALGWEREVAAAIAVGRAADPTDPTWDAFEAQMHLRGGDLELAIVAARRGLQRAPDSAKLRMELATALARAGHDHACGVELAAALRLAPAGDAAFYRRAAMFALLETGDFRGAARHGEAALALQPDDPPVALALADMSLWTGDRQAALARAEAIPGARGRAGACRIRGQLLLADGHHDPALRELELACQVPDPAAELSRAEALICRGAWDPAHAALTRATAIGDGYLFVAWMLRFLAAAGERPAPDAPVNLRQIEEFAEALAEVSPLAPAALAADRQGPLVDATRDALARMGCNRSPFATWHDGHVLKRLSTRTGVRHASRHALQTIRSAHPARALALLDAACARWPRSSLPLAHRGELRMWLGDDAGARADLEASIALNPRTRWAYVGLTLLSQRTGDPAGALAVSAAGIAQMRGTVGPAVYAHRAGARAATGDLAGALVDLQHAVTSHPARTGAWVELGLVHAAAGDSAGLARAFDHLRAHAPGLVSDAAAAVALPAWGDMSFTPCPEDQTTILAEALAMLRGNRSSTCVTYVTRQDQLRTVPHGPAAAHPRARVDADLTAVRAMLLRSLGAR
ncbi:tetratricopeptide repeat protein [Nannocystis bainbridge]|uniref:Tetratricopeptide repeat protein n=1 Tax=Nannocystis bainbridge TaxID=2995303 RepID=A0ABT5E207_9BACT|nr:tetratricopeptide repeat protein [Nannocystis bainbridge]MDC0718998.1 hypothetical protein [Nannocystis bainbridge]